MNDTTFSMESELYIWRKKLTSQIKSDREIDKQVPYNLQFIPTTPIQHELDELFKPWPLVGD